MTAIEQPGAAAAYEISADCIPAKFVNVRQTAYYKLTRAPPDYRRK